MNATLKAGLKPFKAWLVVDSEGTYMPTLHLSRREAQTGAMPSGESSGLRFARHRAGPPSHEPSHATRH